MPIQLILFGQLAELVGAPSLEFQDVEDTDSLQRELLSAYPALSQTNYRMAVEKKIITENALLSSGTKVALLPPFSGG